MPYGFPFLDPRGRGQAEPFLPVHRIRSLTTGNRTAQLGFFPNRQAFLYAVRRTALSSSAIYREKVYTPVLWALGFEGKLAFTQAEPVA